MSNRYQDFINDFNENMELYKCEEGKEEFRNKQIETLKIIFSVLFNSNYDDTNPHKRFSTTTIEQYDTKKSLTSNELESITKYVNTNKRNPMGGSRKSKKSRKTKKSTKRKRTRSKSTKSKKTRGKSKKSTKRKRTRSKSRNNNNNHK